MKRWAKGFKLTAGGVLIILSQFLYSHETGAADPSSLRVVYNALGATMSPAWIAQTTRKVIQQKPDAVNRYLRAYTEALSIIRRDKETAMKVMAKFMKTDNRQVLESIYEEHAPVMQRVPLMTKDEVQAVLDVVKSPKGQQVKPEDFYDNSFIQKLDASGFINSLYAR